MELAGVELKTPVFRQADLTTQLHAPLLSLSNIVFTTITNKK